MKPTNSFSAGFTLVELLIVVALIGILATAVLSALNPIEQVNKTRDAGRKADSAQILEAIDRYYTSNLVFPWNKVAADYDLLADNVNTVDIAFAGFAHSAGAGICLPAAGAAPTGLDDVLLMDDLGCLGNGPLIAGDELKAQFGKRSYFRSNATASDRLLVLKQANEPSVSVCFIPQSKTERQKDGLRFINGIDAGTGIPAGVDATTVVSCWGAHTIDAGNVTYAVTTYDQINWADRQAACYTCLPGQD